MNIALVLSGGIGTRVGGDIPKQYLHVHGKMIIEYCLEILVEHKKIDGFQIVAESSWQRDILDRIQKISGYETKKIAFSIPGENRQLSIWNGLCDMKEYVGEEATVFIHDAARPLLSEQMITQCFEALQDHDGVMPVLPMKDTVYTSIDGDRVSGLLDRSTIFAGQAPELFCFDRYYEACKALLPERILQINGSTEPAIMAGLDIAMIPGDEGNYKITTKEDLERFREKVCGGNQ